MTNPSVESTTQASSTQEDSKRPMEFKSTGGFKRVYKAAGYSVKGLMSAWQNEAAFRQELALTLILLPIALWVDVTSTERVLLLVAVLALVLIVELLNSAVEAAIDRIGTERHELSGQAKDLGSAAVFIALFLVAFCWLTILGDRLLEWIRGLLS